MGLDIDILVWIQENLRYSFGDTLMVGLTHLMDWNILAIAIGTVLICIKKTRWIGVSVIIATLLAYLFCNGIIKPVVDRPRPFEIYSLEPLITGITSSSFPSGHTAGAFAMAMAVFLYNKKYGAGLFIFAMMVAYSRMYCFVHYPSDVFAGAMIGMGCAFLAVLISERMQRTVRKKSIEKSESGVHT